MIIVETYDSPLVAAGRQTEHAEHFFAKNAVDSPEVAAAYTAHINQPHEIISRLRDIPHLYSRITPDGSEIKIHIPTGPYGAGGVQVVALPAEIVNGEPMPVDKDGRILTRTIFDFPEEAQHEYARQVLLAMDAEEQAISAIREKKRLSNCVY